MEDANPPKKNSIRSFLRVSFLLSLSLFVFFFWFKPFFDSPSLKHSTSAYELYQHAKILGDQKKFNLAEKYLKRSLAGC